MSFDLFTLLLVVFHVSFLYILGSSTPIQPQSIRFCGHLFRFYFYEARFLVFHRTDAFVDPVTQPSVFLEGIVSAATLHPRRSQVNYSPLSQIQIISRNLCIWRPPKFLPELVSYIMDTPDSFLVSVLVDTVALR